MVENYKIEDLYFLDMRARQRGLDVGEYITLANQKGINVHQLIEIEKRGTDLDSAVNSMKRKRVFNKLGFGAAVALLAYTLHAGSILLIDKAKRPEHFEATSQQITNLKNTLDDYPSLYFSLPQDSSIRNELASNMFSLSSHLQYISVPYEAEMIRHEERVKKAINPLRHFL